MTLSYLEDQLRIIELEKAKFEDPWELITKPTLFTKPIKPEEKILWQSYFRNLIWVYRGIDN